jgi:predicted Zn finger-like uncharacterized protein
MKITCQACAAKYTIADDKVQGKIVKIRCKKCGATIVVNGNDPAAQADQGAEAARFDYASQGGGGDQWTVNVADGDQRTMSDVEIVDAYHAGVVNDETFAWKDGMGDWLALREIEQLYAQCTATRAMPSPATLGGKPADDDDDGEFATKVQESPLGGASRVPQPPANGYADAAPLAARRANARAPAADLFGSAAQAGSEEDVMTSAPQGMPQPHAAGDDKLTGQRNENSVLFSLNALTSKGGPSGGAGGNTMPAGSEASGLIDIRQLSSQIGLGEDKKKKSRIDDIMNLGGGGAFAPSLGAPVLSAPPIEEYAPAPEATGAAAAAPQGKNRMVIFGAIGAGVLVIAGAIGIASMLMKGGKEETDKAAASASASASAMAATSAAASASAAMAAASASAAPAPTDSTAAVASAAPTDSSAAGAAPTATTTATAKPASTATAAAAPTATAAAATAAANTAAAAAAAAPAAAAGGSDQPFNMGAAKASLGGIAGGAQSCKKGDVSGSGRVTVTFAPSGAVQSVTVEGTGFEGTPAGSCVARMFRGARVPPFSGSPFSVRKSFSIN